MRLDEVDGYVKELLHQVCVELGKRIASMDELTPDAVAGVPLAMFGLELKLRATWWAFAMERAMMTDEEEHQHREQYARVEQLVEMCRAALTLGPCDLCVEDGCDAECDCWCHAQDEETRGKIKAALAAVNGQEQTA